jgi:hypothetical protein
MRGASSRVSGFMAMSARAIERTIALLLLASATAAQALSDPPPRDPKGESQKACEVAAIADYLKEKSALSRHAIPSPSVQQIIERRRLEEQYCLQSVRCGFTEGNDSDHDLLSLEFATLFDNCIRDEALETYQGEPRAD